MTIVSIVLLVILVTVLVLGTMERRAREALIEAQAGTIQTQRSELDRLTLARQVRRAQDVSICATAQRILQTCGDDPVAQGKALGAVAAVLSSTDEPSLSDAREAFFSLGGSEGDGYVH